LSPSKRQQNDQLLLRILTLLLPIALLFSSCDVLRKTTKETLGEEEVATFILVRHAEKELDAKPALTKQGMERADRLAFILERVDLDAVYSSPTKRTRMTAAPTAEFHKLPVLPYDPSLMKDFSKDLKRLYKGKTVLVVGHSNTTPALANYLAKTDKHPRFSELDYTNYYIVTIPRIGKTRVIKMRY
jgi:2,3-bisphosphoglycerate-dependent phosphoglycerate mutase